ncbi:alpha-glucosidase [Clostridium cavendishii DSM 21758]|uniref:Alpha-amylase n=1 Tax=Clostridium cavendishii DSM 21758 TaxID=1121302 RepID=A0A1M6LN71_9CLOT|nr:alpha-glucosidase [Clostridium cavendishii]SHJ72668.1 alpha-glucosidase [Clostridium cavendishii DSM 21758]
MKKIWWKEAVAYQIYPRSFMDSNNDGIGDIKGIISKLDYLEDLGIDVIWICPMYKSPNDDNGYDISDYKDIMDEFGTMEDMDELLEEVHKRGMKLIIDLVINHTSDEHEWFVESRKSIDSPKRDWYIWRNGKYGAEPNNWESIFGGSAWEFDERTKEYFLHLFSRKQPDLNWENKEMRNALYEMINWWLNKGIDGFRIDAISHINKEKGLKDMENPKKLKYVSCFEKHMNVPGIHKYLKELKENTFDKYDIMTVGEANGVKVEHALDWVGEKNGKFNMVFQFEHLNLWSTDKNKKVDIINLKKILSKWQNGLDKDGWNALYIENHDIPRVTSTWGDDEVYLRESATALATMYFMQKGTPFIYQGQELGMTNVKFNTIDEYNDVKSINMYNEMLKSGKTIEEIMQNIWATSRDNSRTPMQWSGQTNAGFSKKTPWIGVNPNYKEINLEVQINDDKSVFNYYKKLISLKKSNEALIYGKYNLIMENDENVYAYTRVFGEEKYIIICNLTSKEAKYTYENIELKFNKLILSNYDIKKHNVLKSFVLRPYEARIYKI